MNHLLLKEILLQGNYWVINKNLVHTVGLESALILSIFAEAEKMLADENGWFYQTSDTLEEITTLSRYKQDQAIKNLENLNILEKEVRGVPAKRYFKINYLSLTNQFSKKLQTGLSKTCKLDPKKITNQSLNDSESSSKKNNKLDSKKLATNKESNIKKINKESNIKKINNSKDISRKYSFDDTQYELAKLLWTKVKSNFPNNKEPNLESWANDLRLMMEQDNRTVAEIKGVIEWSQNNEFWYANIQSARKLREKYETMYAQADRENKQTKPSVVNTGKKESLPDWAQEDYKYEEKELSPERKEQMENRFERLRKLKGMN